MTKRKSRFFRTLRFYNQDLFGSLVLKDPVSKNLSTGFKNSKINKLLYLQLEDRFERRRYFRGLGKEKFFYRIDIVKLRKRRRKLSKFSKQLKTRLVIRKFASQMNVRQFRNYVKKSTKGLSLFYKFLSSIESRLDVILFRSNLFETSAQARQFINHGFIVVNGIVSRFPSLRIKFNDLISVIDKTLFYNKILSFFKSRLIVRSIPSYLEVNFRILSVMFIFSPRSNQVVYPIKVKKTLLTTIGRRF